MKTVDISGMSGGYEATCQKALFNGIRFIKENPNADFANSYKAYQNIYGVVTPETQVAHDLDKSLTDGISDMTGAMHQAVVGHLLYIAQNGHDKWLAEFSDQPERIYETDEDKIDKIIAISEIEWQLKLDGGYNWVDELRKTIPEENWVVFDPDNPEKAIRELKERIGW